MADHNAMLNWPPSDRYAPDWFVGGELEDGSHTRNINTEHGHNAPFSIYRRGIQPGVGDVVLCHGIQHLTDARMLCAMLNARRPVAEHPTYSHPPVAGYAI